MVTNGSKVLSATPDVDIFELQPCTHEEADSRIFLHVAHLASSGLKIILLRTVDSDVVVIAIVLFFELNVSELWVAFGTGTNLQYIPIQ